MASTAPSRSLTPATTRAPLWDRAKNNTNSLIDILFNKNVFSLASAIAYYTVLSLTPFLLLLFAFLTEIGLADRPEVRDGIQETLGFSAEAVLLSMQSHLQASTGGFAFGFLGFFTLLFSATGVIVELQNALTSIFSDTETTPCDDATKRVLPKKDEPSQIRLWVKTRAYAVLALLFCVFVSTVSLVLSVFVRMVLPIEDRAFWEIANALTSIAIFTAIFATMLKYLPKVPRPSWRFCVKGGFLASMLFHLGKLGLATYFANAALSSSYGALSTFVIFLLWAYYNAAIILTSAAASKVLFYGKN